MNSHSWARVVSQPQATCMMHLPNLRRQQCCFTVSLAVKQQPIQSGCMSNVTALLLTDSEDARQGPCHIQIDWHLSPPQQPCSHHSMWCQVTPQYLHTHFAAFPMHHTACVDSTLSLALPATPNGRMSCPHKHLLMMLPVHKAVHGALQLSSQHLILHGKLWLCIPAV